jgi:hypothetical protein
MKLNRFQQFVLDGKASSVITEIIELFHPGYKPVNKIGNLKPIKVYPRFDWIMIEQGDVNIGISYRIGIDGKLFMGTGYTIQDFTKAYSSSYFQAWRFVNDRSYVPNADNNHNMNEFFAEHKVPKPTPQEMLDYYYSE